jgi:hypothetical protein
MERPGYIARTIYGIDELRFEFEHQIEEDLLSGNLQLDGQLQRLLHLFEQTLEVCSASLGSMQLASPGDVQGSISDAVHSGPEEIGDILLIKENDAGHSSSTSRRKRRPQGSQEKMKESNLEDCTPLPSAPLSSETPLGQKKDQSVGIDDTLTESAPSPFCGDDFDSEAAYYLAQSALSQATPHLDDYSYG